MKSETQKAIDKLNEEISSKKKQTRQISLKRMNCLKGTYNDMVNGVMKREIIDKLMNGGYGETPYSNKEAYQVYTECLQLMRYDFEQERPFLKEQLYTYLTKILSDCHKAKDRYNAIQCINSIAKLVGITDNKAQLNIQTNGEVKISFGFNKEGDED